MVARFAYAAHTKVSHDASSSSEQNDDDDDDDDAKSYSKKAMNGKIQGGVEPHLKQPIVDWPR